MRRCHVNMHNVSAVSDVRSKEVGLAARFTNHHAVYGEMSRFCQLQFLGILSQFLSCKFSLSYFIHDLSYYIHSVAVQCTAVTIVAGK